MSLSRKPCPLRLAAGRPKTTQPLPTSGSSPRILATVTVNLRSNLGVVLTLSLLFVYTNIVDKNISNTRVRG